MLPVGRRRGQVGGARIALRAIAALNGDSPWKICRRAVQLLVEEIAPAPDRLHQEQARRNDVRPDTQRMPLPADIGNAGKRSGQSRQGGQGAEDGSCINRDASGGQAERRHFFLIQERRHPIGQAAQGERHRGHAQRIDNIGRYSQQRPVILDARLMLSRKPSSLRLAAPGLAHEETPQAEQDARRHHQVKRPAPASRVGK